MRKIVTTLPRTLKIWTEDYRLEIEESEITQTGHRSLIVNCLLNWLLDIIAEQETEKIFSSLIQQGLTWKLAKYHCTEEIQCNHVLSRAIMFRLDGEQYWGKADRLSSTVAGSNIRDVIVKKILEIRSYQQFEVEMVPNSDFMKKITAMIKMEEKLL